jgi:hypothetical protein
MKRILKSIYEFLVSVGRAKAAAECARMGRPDLARNIILSND